MAFVWTQYDAAPMAPAQLVVRFATDDIDVFVDVNNLSAGPAVGADFTILPAGLEGVVPDPMARCLCVTMVNDGAGVARGISIRIRGMSQFGISVQETVTFPNKAAGTTNIMFTRNAYKLVSQITYMARTGGAVQVNDRLDVGLATLAGTAAGTHDATNGAGATDYKAVGLPLAISAADGIGTAVAADVPTQVHGLVKAEDGTSGVTTWAAISRANDFKVDTIYQTITMDEEFVLSGTGNHEAIVSITPNRRASEGYPATSAPSAPPI